MKYLPHQIPGSAKAARHPIISGAFCVKVDRNDGKGSDLVNGLDGVTAMAFHSQHQASQAATDMNEASAAANRQLVVDGTDQYGHFAGDGDQPPFAVFDVALQDNIAGPYTSREAAEAARQAILKGEPARFDMQALMGWEREGAPAQRFQG